LQVSVSRPESSLARSPVNIASGRLFKTPVAGIFRGFYRRAVAGRELNGKLGRYARERLVSVQRKVASSN